MFTNFFPFGKNKQTEEKFLLTTKGDSEEMFQNWLDKDYEGQLSVDVYETEKEIVVKSTIAGVKPEDLNIIVHNDLLTIRGKREEENQIEPINYINSECYWGGFSRTIVLPQYVKTDKIKAILKNGVLTVILPKAIATAKVKVKEEF
jgi:HSP20 family protein